MSFQFTLLQPCCVKWAYETRQRLWLTDAQKIYSIATKLSSTFFWQRCVHISDCTLLLLIILHLYCEKKPRMWKDCNPHTKLFTITISKYTATVPRTMCVRSNRWSLQNYICFASLAKDKIKILEMWQKLNICKQPLMVKYLKWSLYLDYLLIGKSLNFIFSTLVTMI